QACLQLRRSAAIVYGFAGYCRKQGKPPPAGLDRMLQRVTHEITRMETAVEGLRIRTAGEPTGPDRRPGPTATDPAHACLPDTRKPPASDDNATCLTLEQAKQQPADYARHVSQAVRRTPH